VPRNCVLQLEFSAPVATGSLVADSLDVAPPVPPRYNAAVGSG